MPGLNATTSTPCVRYRLHQRSDLPGLPSTTIVRKMFMRAAGRKTTAPSLVARRSPAKIISAKPNSRRQIRRLARSEIDDLQRVCRRKSAANPLCDPGPIVLMDLNQ